VGDARGQGRCSLGVHDHHHIDLGALFKHLTTVSVSFLVRPSRPSSTHTSVKVFGTWNFFEQCSSACFEMSTSARVRYMWEHSSNVGS
jgi:hypothetical protein